MKEDDLTPEERRWMEDVPREVEPPPELRGVVADRLRADGLLRTRGMRPHLFGLPVARLVASLVFAFVLGGGLGWWGGTRSTGPAPIETPALNGPSRFVLLLYEGPEYQALGSSPPEIVQEYTAWARMLEGSGSLVMADKLADDARVIEPTGRAVGAVPVNSPLVSGELGIITGFFIVYASSYEEAQRIAASSPHVRHGGRIIIRRIDSA
jgi:hypothetical protein